MTAQLEKVVRGRHVGQLEQFGPDPGEHCHGRALIARRGRCRRPGRLLSHHVRRDGNPERVGDRCRDIRCGPGHPDLDPFQRPQASGQVRQAPITGVQPHRVPARPGTQDGVECVDPHGRVDGGQPHLGRQVTAGDV